MAYWPRSLYTAPPQDYDDARRIRRFRVVDRSGYPGENTYRREGCTLTDGGSCRLSELDSLSSTEANRRLPALEQSLYAGYDGQRYGWQPTSINCHNGELFRPASEAMARALDSGQAVPCSAAPGGGVISFLVAASALIRWFLAKRLFRCLRFTRPL